MSDEAIKHRRRWAIQAAIRVLRRDGFCITLLRSPIYDLVAEQPKIIRKIKICLDKKSPLEIKNIVQDYENAIHSRELWIYKTSPGKGWFEIIFI